jgi:hypothetical protein
MVFEATYLVAVLTAGQMSSCCGQNGAQMSKVLRPINKSNGMFICFLMAVETTESECGLIHPPYAKPPLLSSSGIEREFTSFRRRHKTDTESRTAFCFL